jgi:nitroreductase
VYVTGFSLTKPEVAKEIRKILNLPEDITPITVIPVGYPNPEEKLEEKHLRELNEVIHQDKW